MSLALYRRYRPETFAEVIGQEHVTDPLQQALRNNRVNHAYLFSGPRGCGKTTSARILARCLNCEQGPTPTPCGECRSCQDLARGGPGSIDVIEIDAASHGGVDDARDLREKAFFAPVSSRFKIYIIDEAHMVTSAGFNALLKVVEEPPEHLKFIFATTEPEKVIGTIRSRTHHYPFRLVPPGVLRDYLEQVCGQEGIAVDPAVLPLVVRAGAGSVRDSMSVMDQLLAGAKDDGVTYAMATSLLGFTDRALLDDVVDAFAAADGAAAFQVVDRVIEGGFDPRRFVADLLERLRDLVILAAVPDAADKGLIDAPGDQLERMTAQARSFGQAGLTRAADLVNTGLTEMRGATSPRLQLELICARVLLPAAAGGEAALQARVERLERGVSTGAVAAVVPQAAPAPAVAQAPVAPVSAAPVSAAPAAVAPVPPAVQTAAERQEPPAAEPERPRGGAWPDARATQQTPQQASQQAPPPAPVPQQQAPQPAAAAGGGDLSAVRALWPQIVDAVKNRKRVTWVLLQQAAVAGFDGRTLQIAFEHAGYRDGFVNSGHDETLRQAVIDAVGAEWRIECIVGGPGAQARPVQAPAAAAAPAARVRQPEPQRPPQQPAAPGAWPQASRPAAPESQHPAQTQTQTRAVPAAESPNPAPQAPQRPQRPQVQQQPPDVPLPPEPPEPEDYEPPYEAPPVAPEDDVATPDDVDVDDDGMSTHELLARELGATVIEETRHG